MHFITGGSFNGKKKWALNLYELSLDSEELQIIRFYDNERMEESIEIHKPVLVLEGIEYWIQYKLSTLDEEETYGFFHTLFKKMKDWENSGENHQVIVIGSDITKGIVPIKKEDRQWRDATGRIYQEAVNMAERVDVVWYGINERLK
ncbi:bifunctional adenosylcobinamide kinase/adenosylcobinamide-phosphate guanylyltransferase [Niallia sp. 03133]|uniref:bifunctional adenosylcobinamide kinase/adenosylcobinamide-phosphate guanylyltransferase n=1 Tax=Niallia sp. 03133 TaxID=3458060 RepID=UPI004043FC6A